jgi:hypothetical protein
MQPALSAISRGARGNAAAFGDAAADVPLEYMQAAAPRRRRMRGLTTFNIVIVLILFAVLVTVYISNVVAVDNLMIQKIELEREEQLLLQDRETLRAESTCCRATTAFRKSLQRNWASCTRISSRTR